jgi:hypothetical protein
MPSAGLEAVLRSFYQIVEDVKRKPYDLLDYARNTFDRDYLEFNVNIHDLDSQMQARAGLVDDNGSGGALCVASSAAASLCPKKAHTPCCQ